MHTHKPAHPLTVSPSHRLIPSHSGPPEGSPLVPSSFPPQHRPQPALCPLSSEAAGGDTMKKRPVSPPSRVYLVACPRMRCAGCSSPSVQPCAPYLLGEKPSTPITQALQCGTCSARDTCIILNFSLGHHALGGSVGSDSGV